ncbi:spore germination protein [Cohnella thailandensis]|uniref:Spore germination protein n=1 Tax=Cohnella thailandensis TaxID=557557 RepID=A0A841STB3_9BACL|nr:spore germination protein [Cohnella thailandensis]MBB6635563.1 spore germination protein [Cohnella thailandensis]MBP1974943.1 spore germination protein PA/spore germination protein PF [Cohnella thailandensis]
MPCIIGAVKIISVGSSAVVQFGDSIQITPSSTSKSYAGAGSFVTGDLPRTNNFISATNTNDPDVQDSSENTVGNAGVV